MICMARRRGPDETLANQVETGCGRAELLRDADRRAAWMLLIDGVPQSHVDLDDPGYLDFEYVRRLGHVIDAAAPAGQPLRVLHLGAGALTLARYVAATRPGSSQLAVEVDAALVDFIRLRLPLGAKVRVRVGDARVDALTRQAAADPMPGRVLHGRDLARFTAGARPVADATATPSPAAPPGAFAS